MVEAPESVLFGPAPTCTFSPFVGEKRLNRLEGEIARLSHFIGADLRPDLLTPALGQADPGQGQELERLSRELEK